MKVLMLGWELPPHNSGGLGVACLQLCRALSDSSVDIDFVLPYSAKHKIDFMKISAAHPQGYKTVQRAGSAYDSQAYIDIEGNEEYIDIHGQQELYEHGVELIAEQKQFDIIHAHDWLTFRAAIRAKQSTDKPLILHVHSIENDRAGGNRGNPLVREIEATAMLLADQVIAVSEHTKRAIIRDYDIPAEKIEVIHNSIDSGCLEELDEDNAYSYLTKMKADGYKVVVNVGRLTIQKNLNNLMHAARIVVEHEPKTIFLVVGSGELDYELMELAADLGISSNVIFTGFQRGKNWRDSFAIADLFLMPSISEPFGLTVLEASGYNTPSLISRQSGVSEVLKNCLKVDFWDINEMANQIVSVVRYDGLRTDLKLNSFNEYRDLSWSKSAKRLIKIYQSHLEKVAV